MDGDSTGQTRRHLLRLVGGVAVLVGYQPAFAQHPVQQSTERRAAMKIERNGSRPSTKGPQDYFCGSVLVEPVFQVGDPMRLNAGSVTFEPGARTAWHTHPLGQTLIITAGLGWVQTEGGSIEEVRPGDVVWFPPGEKHWHGATPTTAMTHIAVQEALNGKNVDWMEKVSDMQYNK
jgi:quercetin dioxygenase-like cupin family protein